MGLKNLLSDMEGRTGRDFLLPSYLGCLLWLASLVSNFVETETLPIGDDCMFWEWLRKSFKLANSVDCW